jgi:hypothetical protein
MRTSQAISNDIDTHRDLLPFILKPEALETMKRSFGHFFVDEEYALDVWTYKGIPIKVIRSES